MAFFWGVLAFPRMEDFFYSLKMEVSPQRWLRVEVMGIVCLIVTPFFLILGDFCLVPFLPWDLLTIKISKYEGCNKYFCEPSQHFS